MSKGRVYDDPQFRYTDAYSGREVIRLTDYLGHSNHFYFTDPCWFNDNKSFFFMSDRENKSNLFRYDLEDGKIMQLTDFQTPGQSRGCWSDANQRLYYWRDQKIIELDPDTFEEREIYQAPPDWEPEARANPTADGKYVISRLQEHVPQDRPAISFAYSRFHEMFHRKPLTQIIRVEVATGNMEVIFEDKRFMTHINTSHELPNIMTYCHEGPWYLVEQRIWGLNIETGETWKIRPQDDGKGYAVGHEYWFQDGETIGYHGFPRDDRFGGEHVFGHIKWDNSEHVEVSFPFRSTHFQSMDESIIVGDGSPAAVFSHQGVARPFIQLFKWNGEDYEGPRVLAYHRSTFNDQHAHPHPRFTPDGKYVLYSSDLTAYSNMYLVEVGDFYDLPLLTDDIAPQHT
ncbi:MAG: PD40 domain-containing protein [Anaerolineae bacterium]|nr:PD40 domain-containing protein [Anaerolineae bacterium]